jgi:DNA-binding LacI/PurR family transcriptional regulator
MGRRMCSSFERDIRMSGHFRTHCTNIMDKQRKLPGIKKASDFITRQLETGQWKRDEKHPPIRQLANMAGISKDTMLKACRMLKQQGLLFAGEQQHATLENGSFATSAGLNEHRLIWQRKRSQFEKDLLSGTFGTGKLPSMKELQFRYKVNFRTMQKIIVSMGESGILDSEKGGRLSFNRATRSQGTRIVFITFMGFISQQSALNKEHNRIARFFESECLRRGMQLEIVEIDFYDSTKTSIALKALVDNDLISGFIIDLWWYTSPGFRRAYLDTLDHCAAFNKPIALLDELANFELPVQFEKKPFIQVFTIEGQKAGERVAGFLIGHGHTSAAFISLAQHELWSERRFEGVARRFSQAGLSGRIHPVVDSFFMPMPAMLSASGLSDAAVRKLLAIGRTPAQAADLERTWEEYNHAPNAQSIITNELKLQLYKNLSSLSHALEQDFDHDFQKDICTSAIITAGKRLFASATQSLFERALAHPQVTAWICATDAVALSALAFLRDQKIKVPDSISVTGFDNDTADALEHRLTTFDFNAMGFVHRMLNFIAHPPRPRGPYRHRIIEVEGIIMERDTTGPAKKR